MRALVLALLVSLSAGSAASAFQDPPARVSAVATAATDRFTDVTAKGRPESEFKDKFVRFVTAEHPEGFVARIKAFDPATGEFTLYATVPAGLVNPNDVYQIASMLDFPGAFASTSSVACLPAGTAGADVITCSGADTTGVAALGGKDVVNVNVGASVGVIQDGILAPTAAAVSGGDDQDTVTNAGAVRATAAAVLTPVLTPPSPVPGASLVWGAVIATGPDAKGIDGGTGNDTLTNTATGTVIADAHSILLPSVVNGTAEGLSKADVSSTSKATATGIAGGDDADAITNSGTVTPDASASAFGVNIVMKSVVEPGKGGKSAVKGTVTALTASTGIAGGDRNDTVTNGGAIDATSSSLSIAAAASTLDVKGSAAASASAYADGTATGIELGLGNDTLTNTGAISAATTTTANSVNVAIDVNEAESATTKKQAVKATADGSAVSRAGAIGIAGDNVTPVGDQVTDINLKEPTVILFNDGEKQNISSSSRKPTGSVTTPWITPRQSRRAQRRCPSPSGHRPACPSTDRRRRKHPPPQKPMPRPSISARATTS